MSEIKVDIVSAETSIFSGSARFVALPGESGELGVLPGHIPLITRIRPGVVRVQQQESQEELAIYVHGGILEIQPDAVTVLADVAVRGADLDEARVLEAKKEAEKVLSSNPSPSDYQRALHEMIQANAQLAALQSFRGKIKH